jgi:hypothetical protein
VYIYQVGQHLGVVRTVTTIRFRGLGATGLNRSGRAYPLARGRRARPKERRSEPPARIVEIALSAMCMHGPPSEYHMAGERVNR